MNNLSAEELQDYLLDEEDIDLMDLKLLRYYSALSGKEDIVAVVDNYLEEVYNL